MRILLPACLWCALAASGLQAEERCFVVLLASEAPDQAPRRAHTFATFLKIEITKSGGAMVTKTLETATISWLPASGNIRLLALPERGRNFDLAESLAWAKERGLESTTVRGPFEISKDLYKRALEQKEWLESGAVAYKALDGRLRPQIAINCIHAVSDLIPGPLLPTGTAHGDAATALVAEHFRPHLTDAERSHLWAFRHLDLNGEPLVVQNDPGTRTVSTPTFAE